MKKHTLLPLTAAVGGIVAFLLRLWQNRTGFESNTGLPIPGNLAGIALVACLLALAVLLLLLTSRLPKESGSSPAFPADFVTEDAKWLMLPVMGILLMGVAGLADLYEGLGMGNLLAQMQSAADPYATVVAESAAFSGKLQLLLGLLSLASAAALLSAAAACRSRTQANPTSQRGSLLLVPPVALVVRLVLTYRHASVDPALEAYYVELLALIFLTLGFYRLSSFAFQAGRTHHFSLYACAAVVLSFAALADGGPHLSSLLLYAGGAIALLGFLLLRLSHSGPSTAEKAA